MARISTDAKLIPVELQIQLMHEIELDIVVPGRHAWFLPQLAAVQFPVSARVLQRHLAKGFLAHGHDGSSSRQTLPRPHCTARLRTGRVLGWDRARSRSEEECDMQLITGGLGFIGLHTARAFLD